MSTNDSNASFTRRQMLRNMAAAGLAAASPPVGLLGAEPPGNVVVQENQRPGTRDWMLRQTRIDPESRYRSPWIEGYCSHSTIRAGETISFHVSTNPASPFTLDIYRTGYYGGDVQVSFRRPYGKYCQILDAPLSLGSGEWLLWEFPLAYWMESLGYDVTYISNLDTHRDPNGLRRARGFLSVGHDEYWTIEMFQNVRAAVAAGVNVAFLSGNAVCGRIQYDDTLPAFERVGMFGPPGGTREFEHMSTLEHRRPYANELIGAHSTGPVTGGADWTCRLPDHWLFAGTGMRAGDSIPGLVGWEYHGDPAPIAGLEIVASGPTQQAPGEPNGGNYTATIYPGPKKNFVFNAATIWWADGLSAPPGYVRPHVYTTPQGPDQRVQQITRNLLAAMCRK